MQPTTIKKSPLESTSWPRFQHLSMSAATVRLFRIEPTPSNDEEKYQTPNKSQQVGRKKECNGGNCQPDSIL
jgi:hypothetical protein